MTELNRIRDGIRRFVSDYEKPVLWVFRGLLSLWILHLIRTWYGYSTGLEDLRLSAALALICAFVPWSFGALILLVFLLLELYSLSAVVALVALAFVALGYLLCAFYGAKHVHNIAYIPPCYPGQFSFAMPMISALYGSVSEITSVLCGGVFAFFLATVRKNSSMFIDGQSVSIPDLLLQSMLGNRLLYYYLAALAAMFLVTWVVRTRKMRHAWLIAVLAGVASETLIMAVGYNATGNGSRTAGLLGVNLLLVLIGAGISFFVRGLDYARIEELQFEDDDYFYYVTAVPKMRFVEEEKRVKRITGSGDERDVPVAEDRSAQSSRTAAAAQKQRTRRAASAGRRIEDAKAVRQKTDRVTGSAAEGEGTKTAAERRADTETGTGRVLEKKSSSGRTATASSARTASGSPQRRTLTPEEKAARRAARQKAAEKKEREAASRELRPLDDTAEKPAFQGEDDE